MTDRDIKPANLCRLGCWLDLPPSLALREPYLSRLRALPLSELCVMLDGSKPGLVDLRWREADCERLRDALPGMPLIATTWQTADREQIDATAKRLPSLMRALGTTWSDNDCEPFAGWRKPRGFRTMREAAAYLVARQREAGATTVCLNTFPSAIDLIAGAYERAPEDGGADQLCLQVYSTRTSGHTVAQCADWLRQARAAYPHLEVVAGIAAYGAPGSALAAQTAHVRSALQAAGQVVSACRIWSAKHLTRTTARHYAVPAL